MKAMKVLLLSIPTGGGHHQAAKAIESYFESYDNVECKMLDIAENVNSIVADMVSKGYIFSTTKTPKLFGSVYDFLDLRENPSPEASKILKVLSQAFRKKLYAYLDEFKPDVIVSTHVFVTVTLNRMAKHKPINAKLISIVTDFTIHPIWEQARSDYFVTASELLNYQAIKKWGTTENVLPFGIPVHPKFSKKLAKSDARKLLGIEDKFTVLVMMGSMGYGTHTIEALEKLDKMNENLQILIICGNNEKLKNKLSEMTWNKTVSIYGFVDNVDVYMDACDCIITKPGGLSTSEALAKELPILMLNPIPGQEDRNREFMQNNGLAMSISESFGVDEAVYQLMHASFKTKQLKSNVKYFAKPNAAHDLCELILRFEK